jgi:hypothetical protein
VAHLTAHDHRRRWSGEGVSAPLSSWKRGGAHFSAVTCAAFHPTFPLIATGGVGSRWIVVVIRAEMQMCRDFRRWTERSKSGAYTVFSRIYSFGIPVLLDAVTHFLMVLAKDMLFTRCNSTTVLSHWVVPRPLPPTEQSIEGEDQNPELVWFGSPCRIFILRWLRLNHFFPLGETRHQDVHWS